MSRTRISTVVALFVCLAMMISIFGIRKMYSSMSSLVGGANTQPTAVCETTAAAYYEQVTNGRYNITLISIFKSEHFALRQWVMHYLSEGIDHITLVDNNDQHGGGSNTEESCILAPFIAAGVVTLVRDSSKHKHLKLLDKQVMAFRTVSKWILNVELDEFMYSRPSLGHSTIWSYLSSLSLQQQIVLVPWRMFSSAGSVEPSEIILSSMILTKNYTEADVLETKWIARGVALSGFSIHLPKTVNTNTLISCETIFSNGCCRNGSHLLQHHHHDYDTSHDTYATHTVSSHLPLPQCLPNPCPDEWRCHADYDDTHVLHLNHYPIHSREFFYHSKMVRGDARDPKLDSRRDWSYYHGYNSLNRGSEVVDEKLLHKRSNQRQQDQERIDWLLCGTRHFGGSIPSFCRDNDGDSDTKSKDKEKTKTEAQGRRRRRRLR